MCHLVSGEEGNKDDWKDDDGEKWDYLCVAFFPKSKRGADSPKENNALCLSIWKYLEVYTAKP